MTSHRFNRALLVNPPTGLYRRDDRCQCKVEDQTVQIVFPPIELASIGAVLLQEGVQVWIRDYPAMKATWEDYAEDLRTLKPDMVMVNVITATSSQDFQALEMARQALGETKVITLAKGEFMDTMGEEALRENPQVDFGFHGEIEQTLLLFLKGEPMEAVPGLLWRKDAANGAMSIMRNEGHPLLEDLDALPWPARQLLDNNLYRSPETGNPLTVIHGNRGCPSKCIFCPAGAISGYRVRYRSPQSITDEIKECVSRFGLREFLFHGDTFTINKKWLIELCDLIIASGLKIRWGCNSRIDTIDDDRAAKMKAAGCWVVAFGVESGNQQILDYMKKGQKAERAKPAVEICKRHGLRVHTFFVIGTPLETHETLRQTLAFVKDLDPDFFDFNISYPLPGTELYEIATREGLFERHPTKTGYADAAVRSYELSSEELTRWRKKALLSLYLRPKYIARTLYQAGSPRLALNYLKAGGRRFRQLVVAARSK